MRTHGVISGCVGLWRLDSATGLVNCVTPGTNDLINVGTTLTSVGGMPFTYAREFSKADRDYLYAPANAALDFDDDGKMSFGCYIKPYSWDTGGASFLWKLDSTGGYTFYYNNTAGELVVGIKTGSVLTTLSYAVTLDLNEWHHIGFSIHEEYNRRIYADGASSGILTSPAIGNSLDDLFIGRDGDVTSRDFDGLIADVMLNGNYWPLWEANNIWKAVYNPMQNFLV